MQIQTPLESGLFSTLGDLPLHPLVVHFAVVLLPLSALVLLVAAFLPAVRRRFLGFAVILAGVGVIATFISKESGESLAAVVGEPEAHAQWADRLMVVSAAYVVAAVIWWILARRAEASVRRDSQGAQRPARGVSWIFGLFTAALSVAVIVLSILTGHSGAQAAWGSTMGASSTSVQQESDGDSSASGQSSAGESAAASGSSSTSSADQGDSTYTLADVQSHSSSSDCWAAVDNNVYDLTDWISQHPGGERAIEGLCGTDATQAFANQHGSNQEAQAALVEQKIGTLSS